MGNFSQQRSWPVCSSGERRKAIGYQRIAATTSIRRGEGPFTSRHVLPTRTSPLLSIPNTHTHIQDAVVCEDRRLAGPARCVFCVVSASNHDHSSLARRPSSFGVQSANRQFPSTARPTTSLAPFRAAAAFSSSSRNDAAGAVQPHAGYGLAKPQRKEVLLPSQEGTKGLVQYALYVSLRRQIIHPTSC